MRGYFATMLLVSLVASSAPASIVFKYQGVEHAEAVQVLDIGQLAIGESRTFSFEIVNAGALPVTVAMFPSGIRTTVRWNMKASSLAPIDWVKTILPGQNEQVNVTFNASPDEALLLETVIFRADGKDAIVVVFDYLLRKDKDITIHVKTTGLNSGDGKDYSEFYWVCSGPAPTGYTVKSHSFQTRQVPANNDLRACGTHVECPAPHPADITDTDVCRKFRVQGAERSSRGPARSVEAAGDLYVTYTLIEKPDPEWIPPKD
jgi:hypothetical protein